MSLIRTKKNGDLFPSLLSDFFDTDRFFSPRWLEREFENTIPFFTLPQFVNAEKVDAKYDDGILKLCIPKKEEAKAIPEKEIKVA